MKANEMFLEGRLVFLRKPDVQTDVTEGEWHSWFNDLRTTRYLIHGVFPVSREDEAALIRRDLNNPCNPILAVVDKESGVQIGVISLKSIDWINRCAEIGMVIGKKRPAGASLEAMALLTKHAFDRLNLERVYGGQHEGLWPWVNMLELIGYRVEGCRRRALLRNGRHADVLITSVLADDFRRLEKERGGDILTDSIEKLLDSCRHENPHPKIRAFFESLSAR